MIAATSLAAAICNNNSASSLLPVSFSQKRAGGLSRSIRALVCAEMFLTLSDYKQTYLLGEGNHSLLGSDSLLKNELIALRVSSG